jgi:hypothetical protein
MEQRPSAPSSSSSSSDLVPAEPGYTLRAVLASAATLTPAAALAAPASLAASPCLRRALLWGGGVALLLAAHRLRGGGSALRTANDAALGWAATAGLQWTLCRRDEHDRRLALRAFYAHRQQAAAPPPPPPPPAAGAGGAGAGEDWRGEVERLTTYDGAQSRVVREAAGAEVVMR